MAPITTLTPSAMPGQRYVFVAKDETVGVSFVDFGAWISQNPLGLRQTQTALRAQIQASRIADKPESVVFKRNGVNLEAQTVRIEWTESLTEVESEMGRAIMRRGYIIHHHGHPTLPPLDIEVWDTFVIYDKEYTVLSINYHLIGQVQAAFEAV